MASKVIMKGLLYCAVVLLSISMNLSFLSAAKLGRSGDVSSRLRFADITRNHDEEMMKKCKKHSKPMDCEEVMENGNTESGVYTIWPRSRVGNCQSIDVYCDMETAGGGWTVIQRRGDFGNAENYFDKTWQDYKSGFGNLNREFWLGNDNIFAITNQGRYSVRFDMTNNEEKSVYAVYESFWIEDESKKYALHMTQFSGSTGDALGPHNLKQFYTKDQPNIPNDAKKDGPRHTGGWWFNVYPSSNLNALNNNGVKHKDVQLGICWNPFGGYKSTIMSTEIKVIQRRGNFGNAQNYFDKTWKDYKSGFGNLKREFWIGNENILAITNQAQYSIRFEVKNKEGKSAFAVYESFWIDDESKKYILHLRDYSGNAGDSMTPHSEREFYTKDKPNVPADVNNNGTTHTGGWWFNRLPSTNLNALNNNGEKHTNVRQGMAWQAFGDYSGTITFSEMKVRSNDF
ncbi:techylectin-5A [Nephila pilipes]|uniref:Techylectin-5A n=1 Tax=Nephila pilipes TaxID=299642 RepID=A0A8X6NWF3_NEPPI|nr:techylectin-5A [Nephila pilipes]